VTPRFWFGVSVALVLLAVVPWTDIVTHSHWGKVQWFPFMSPPVKIRDILVNVALYLPFGYSCAAALRVRRPAVVRVALLAAALSVITEVTQVYSHSRFPSVQDVTCNVFGAVCGAWWAKSSKGVGGD
jgi:VanZ family protein